METPPGPQESPGVPEPKNIQNFKLDLIGKIKKYVSEPDNPRERIERGNKILDLLNSVKRRRIAPEE